MSLDTATEEPAVPRGANGRAAAVPSRPGQPPYPALDSTLARRYHLTRLLIALVLCVASAVLVLAWEWWPGLFVSGFALLSAGDAWLRHEGRWSGSPLVPLIVDSTAIGFATVLGTLPSEVVIPPFSYIVVSAFALLPTRSALRFLPYPVACIIVHLLIVQPGGWEGAELWTIRVIALLTFLPAMVGILIAASTALQKAGKLGAQLSASRQQLDLTVTGAPLVLFEYDHHGVFTLSEGAGLAQLGLAPGEVVGSSVFDVYADEPGVLAGVRRSLDGEAFSEVVQVGELFFQVQYSPQFDEHGRPDRVIGLAVDVSDRMAAEAALQELVRSKDQFVATIAHELRTPLTAVVGLSEELRASHQSFNLAEMEEFISMIADQSHEVAAIVEDLLVAARADIGKVTVVSEEVDLHRSIEAVLTETNHLRTADTRSISVSGPAAWAEADPQRVRQILRNLVTNAFRYGGPSVWIEVAANGAWSKVVVADSGSGISEAEQESIFEPFRRAHNAPGLPGSMGLGLSVSRKLAELMNGMLVYRRTDGRSEFELSLPATRLGSSVPEQGEQHHGGLIGQDRVR